jgi:hypothetical protein
MYSCRRNYFQLSLGKNNALREHVEFVLYLPPQASSNRLSWAMIHVVTKLYRRCGRIRQ